MAKDPKAAKPEPEDLNDGDDVKPLDDEPRGKSKKMLLLALIPILLIGTGAGLYFSGVLDGVLGKKEPAAAVAADGSAVVEEEVALDKDGKPLPPAFMEIPDLLVNLNTAGGPPRFLKLRIKLELANPKDLEKLQAISPKVVDQFQTFLREMRVQDLRGSAGLYRLRQELLYRVNLAAQPMKVKDVLFQEMLIQ